MGTTVLFFFFFLPPCSTLVYVLLHKTHFLNCQPFRWVQVWVLVWWQCLTLVTTSLSPKTKTATSEASQLECRTHWTERCQKMQNNAIPNLYKRQQEGETEALRWWGAGGNVFKGKTCEVKDHKIGESEWEDIPLCIFVASRASFFKEKKRVDAQEVCVNRQLVGGHTWWMEAKNKDPHFSSLS